MTSQLFLSLDSELIAEFVDKAERSVCYAAPGIQQAPADAVVRFARRHGPELVTVLLDFDERVMRMGFGDLAAVTTLRDAGIAVRSTSGLRTGFLVVDDDGYIFTPIARYLEADRREPDAPNAMRLSPEQAREALSRLSPAAKAVAVAMAKTPEEQQRIREQAVEVRSDDIPPAQFAAVAQRLEEAPPVRFDVARQVRVFEPYLQYVEPHLTGAAIQRRKLAIPKIIQNLGAAEGAQSRFNTTFDLIERSSELSSKHIEDALEDIRKNFTPSLGKDHGRVLLKAQKPLFEQRLDELRAKLEEFQATVKAKLKGSLDASREEIIAYYVPRVLANPPDKFRGQLLRTDPTEEDARRWLRQQLESVIPTADDLIKKMELKQTYKDVTFETLNKPDFLQSLREAFSGVDWDKAYSEFQAAGEAKSSAKPGSDPG
ncbi:hypothetical protein [Rhodovarius lipocyclicus]|uniref:hypothetical protein n=1 Tax=Rhodovarius lipocyclicus TaxID=268410 RepID=UPI001357FE1A|nr:hypothetical protein [Rhodovarius lipocyclicus]